MPRFAPALLALALLANGCGQDSSEGSDRVRLRNFHKTLEAEIEAVDHVGDPAQLHWAQLGEAGVGLSCVDGRADDEILGTPGGDAGELLLLLAAAEAEGAKIDVAEVPPLIDAWIERFGPFYMHTDAHALDKLGGMLAADPRFQDAGLEELDTEAFEAWLRDPPEELREPLLSHLVHPDAVGCGHLGSVLRAPEDYEVRPALAGAVIVGVYRQLWATPEQTRFVVLSGEHAEKGIVDVEVDLESEDQHAMVDAVPLLMPRGDHEQVFVLQPQAVAAVRDQTVELLVARHPELDASELREQIHRLGEKQLEATLDHLDVHVPTIRVLVDREGHERLEPLGVR